ERRRSRGFVLWLAELGDLVELAVRRFSIDAAEERPRNKQNRQPAAAPPGAGIRCVAKFRIVDVVGMGSADVLLRNEAGGTKRPGMVPVHGGKQLAHQRQRPCVAAPGLGAARGIASYHQGLTAFAEITRIC